MTPAVTLASTLAKLDSGSYFTAKVSGHDVDGRTVITSDLGTYLVQSEQKYVEELAKIKTETQIEIRVITIDKEIKAEIIKPSINELAPHKPVIIPVHLTLTEIGTNTAHNELSASSHSPTIPLDDVRSQYQATTLYKAERIAREIADKLDNLPLPTSSPNYTVYGNQSAQDDKTVNLSTRQFSPNVFIQEVATHTTSLATNDKPVVPTTDLKEILGKNINVQVIKAVPKTQTPLPAGLPEIVIKELSELTPLDYVKVGQNLNINISAIAIPEVIDKSLPQTNVAKNEVTTSPVKNAVNVRNTVKEVQTTIPQNNPPARVTTPPTTNPAITVSQQPVKETVVSGIIIDTSLKTNTHNKSDFKPVSQENSLAVATETAYNQNNNSQITDKNYYLATPTSVLKFQSNTPLVPGTIVSFTVQSNTETSRSEKTSIQTPNTNPQQVTTTQPPQIENNIKPDNSVAPVLLDKIDQFLPQPLDLLIEDWGSISLALSALTSASSASMAAILSSRIPNMQSPEQITTTMFFFLAALKSPQPARTWLGPDVSAKLKQLGAGKVIDQIDRDFSRIARINSESPVGEWRPVLIPLQNGPDLSAIPMLTKQIIDEEQQRNKKNDEDEDKETKIKATRFILEINF